MEVLKSMPSIYERFTASICSFFEMKPIEEHFHFFEVWLEQVTTEKYFTENNHPATLLSFYDHLAKLYNLGNELLTNKPAFEQLTAAAVNDKHAEIIYNFRYLSGAEFANPVLVIQAVFENYDIEYYRLVLRKWLEESLSSYQPTDISDAVFPFYFNSRRLMEALWLIWLKLNKKQPLAGLSESLHRFEDTCPNLLNQEERENPFQVVEHFYDGADLIEYRNDLKQWLIEASGPGICAKNGNNLLYLHNQIVKLLEAGYYIVKYNLIYKPGKFNGEGALTLGAWLKSCQARRIAEESCHPSDFEVKYIEGKFYSDPLSYLRQVINLNAIKKLRKSLLELLYAGLSVNSYLDPDELAGAYRQQDELFKILEAFYLIIMNAE